MENPRHDDFAPRPAEVHRFDPVHGLVGLPAGGQP